MLGGVALTTNPNALRPNVADGYSPDPRRSKPAYSITSSARASKDGGTGSPSPFAVLRLIASRYLVGACTGMLAGFSPLRMRST